MKRVPDNLGQVNAPTRPRHKADALAPICDINEQCLHMLVEASHSTRIPNEPFVDQILDLVASADSATIAAAARFPFLLVDFGFRDPLWWREIISDTAAPFPDIPWPTPFSREQTIHLARATTMLAWHTVRTDIEASVVLIGVTPKVASILKTLRLHNIDRLAEKYSRWIRPRWDDRPGVWRQLFVCAKSLEVETAHEFVLHALQLTAGPSLPVAPRFSLRAPAEERGAWR